MEGTNCNGEGGWTRVAFVNMSEPGATCPQGLTQRNLSGLTLCEKSSTGGCSSTIFSTLALNYSQMCGQLRGYQFRNQHGFGQYNLNPTTTNIDNTYVDGVSITYGSAPRKHIWTYAGGLNNGPIQPFTCPCNEGNLVGPPPFVGSDYYCECYCF